MRREKSHITHHCSQDAPAASKSAQGCIISIVCIMIPSVGEQKPMLACAKMAGRGGVRKPDIAMHNNLVRDER